MSRLWYQSSPSRSLDDGYPWGTSVAVLKARPIESVSVVHVVNGVQVNVILYVSRRFPLAFSTCVEGEPGNEAIRTDIRLMHRECVRYYVCSQNKTE